MRLVLGTLITAGVFGFATGSAGWAFAGLLLGAFNHLCGWLDASDKF